MSELTLTIIKLGFLAVLWLFVLTTVSAIRSDLFGTAPKPPKAAKALPPPKPQPRGRGEPTQLVVVGGVDRGRTVPLARSPIVLGRGDDVDLRLDDEYVSTRHVRLVPRDGQWFVEDLGSTNGTHIGEARVTTPVLLQPRTALRLGKTVVELRK